MAFDAFDFDVGDIGGYYPGDVEPSYPASDFGYDPGAFEVPSYAQPVLFDYEGAGFGVPGGQAGVDFEGFYYDTGADELVSPAGQRTTIQDVLQGKNPWEQAAGQVEDLVRTPRTPGTFERGGVLGEGGAVFGSPLGRAGVTGALGLAGMGLARAIAGGEPNLRLPQPRTAAGFQAGEQALMQALGRGGQEGLAGATGAAIGGQRLIAELLRERAGREGLAEAEQAPFQRDIRLRALGMAPGLMEPSAVGTFDDPIESALRAELLTLLGGQGGTSPATAQRHRQEQNEMRQGLARQLGPEFELTTPGIQALEKLRERQNAEIFAERESAIARRAPQQQSRQQFSYLAPVQRAAGLEGIRRPALQDVERLSDFGLRGVPETLTGLRSVFPVSSLTGPEGAQRAADIGTSLEAQQALTSFQGRTQRQRELTAGLGGLFGQVAQAATQRPSALERYFEQLTKQGGMAL